MKPLTTRQEEVFDFIVKFYNAEDNLPSSRVIAYHFGFVQTAGYQVLLVLEKKGYLERRYIDGSKKCIWRLSNEWRKTNENEI